MTTPAVAAEPHIEWDRGRPYFDHDCLGVRECEPLPLADGYWRSDESTDTVEPSISCEKCGTHGFWCRGGWVPVGGTT